EGDGLLEVIRPAVEGLVGNGVDQVDAEAIESSLASDVEAARDIVGVMMTLEDAQFIGMKALCAEAEAVDAVLAQHSAVIEADGRGIALDGPLREGREAK